MLHPGLTGSCLGLLLLSGLGLSAVPGTSLHCSRLACPFCTSPGVPKWRHHSVPWLRITVDSWGTSGVGGTSAPPCCCLLAATMLHTCSLNHQETSYLAPQTIVKNCGAATAPPLQLQHQTSWKILPSELKEISDKLCTLILNICLAIHLPCNRRSFNSPVLNHFTTHSLA